MTPEPKTLALPPSGAMPNNPWLPVLLHRGVLPAGTGHRNRTPGADLLTVGAYPPGAVCDVRRAPLPREAVARMRDVPFPDSDPVRAGAARWCGRGHTSEAARPVDRGVLHPEEPA